MNEKKRRDEETLPKAKRTGRDGVDRDSLPGEYADDMRVNRFTPPPEPEKKESTTVDADDSATYHSPTQD